MKIIKKILQIVLCSTPISTFAVTPMKSECHFAREDLEIFILEDHRFQNSPVKLTLPKSLGAYKANNNPLIAVNAWRMDDVERKMNVILGEDSLKFTRKRQSIHDREIFSIEVQIYMYHGEGIGNLREKRAKQSQSPSPFKELSEYNNIGMIVEATKKTSGQIYGNVFTDQGLKAYFFTSAGFDKVPPHIAPEVVARFAAQLLILSQACNTN